MRPPLLASAISLNLYAEVVKGLSLPTMVASLRVTTWAGAGVTSPRTVRMTSTARRTMTSLQRRWGVGGVWARLYPRLPPGRKLRDFATLGPMSWIDPDFPPSATPTDLVGRVLGLNPGMMTGPGTNTYLVGRNYPILIDRHRDHLGGVGQLRELFPGVPVSKLIFKDSGLPEDVDMLQDGEVVEGDGVTLVPIHTPGHASDHLCFFLKEERALFSGDLILNGSTTVIPDEDGDLGQYLDSLRRVQALGVRHIYPAHGPVIEDGPGKIQEYIDHRMLRERQILEVLGRSEEH